MPLPSPGIPVELFQILKDDAVKLLHSICQQIWKTQQWPQDWKRSILFQSQRRALLKNVQTATQLHSSQFSSVAQSCPTLCDPVNRSMPGLPVHQQVPEFTQKSTESVLPSSHLILCHPLLRLPPIPPSIRVFSNDSTLRMRWPKYWSFSFSIIPSKEIPGLISFRMDWVASPCSPRDSQ